MEVPTDSKILVALIATLTSIFIAMITFVTKLISDFFDRKRINRSELMNIRNEILINNKLSELIGANVRTYGIRFKDSVWTKCNASVIYHRQIPFERILNLYANIQSFNTLNTRSEKIMADKNYTNKETRLSIEHAEMISIAEKINKDANYILDSLIINSKNRL